MTDMAADSNTAVSTQPMAEASMPVEMQAVQAAAQNQSKPSYENYRDKFALLLDKFADLPAVDAVPHIAGLRALSTEQIADMFAADFAPANIGKHLTPLMERFGSQATENGQVNIDKVWQLAAAHAEEMANKIDAIKASEEAQQTLFTGFGITDVNDQAQLSNLVGYLAANPDSKILLDAAVAHLSPKEFPNPGEILKQPEATQAEAAKQEEAPKVETPEEIAARSLANYVNSLMEVATGEKGTLPVEQIPGLLRYINKPELLSNQSIQRFLQSFEEGKTNFQQYGLEEQRMLLASALMEGHKIEADQAKLILPAVKAHQAVMAMGWVSQAPNPKLYHDMQALAAQAPEAAGGREEHKCSGPDCGQCKAPEIKQETAEVKAAAPAGYTTKIAPAAIKPEAVVERKATHAGPALLN